MPVKKTRQRNRARNKANRPEGEDATHNHKTTSPILDVNNNDESCEDKNVARNVAAAGLVCKESPPAAATAIATDKEETIRLIQHILREKILKQAQQREQRQQQTAKVEAPKAAVTAKQPESKEPELMASSVKKSKSKEKLSAQSAFIQSLRKKMASVENAAATTNSSDDNGAAQQSERERILSCLPFTAGGGDLPSTLLGNLQKLFDHEPVSDVATSDEEDEYIEYIYKPRQYFSVSLCNFCKCDLSARVLLPCSRCDMCYYCSEAHMKCDQAHRQLCYALRQVADSCGTHLFYKCGDFSTEQFRMFRVVNIRKAESLMNRPLTATEQEVILFPRICSEPTCREYRFKHLTDCSKCGQVAHCKDKPEHLSKQHNLWCKPYQLFKELIIFQQKFGRLDPSLPSKVLTDLPGACSSTKQILSKLSFDMHDPCEYAALSQISTGPLTAWYALKLCDKLKMSDTMVVHLIGAEIEFEVDVLHKWELFFLHITPTLKELHVVFVGPELNPRNISFDQLKKTKPCRHCRKADRTVKYHFESKIYHDYVASPEFIKPDLICFFNAGLYRSTGFHLEDTWPETILAAANLKCPVVVTSYTEYEAPLDMARFVQESNRRLNVVLPPIVNTFASDKPERNFISDYDAPLMFKNYYCFVVE